MSYGLRVFDAGGAKVLDVSDRLTRYVSSYSINLPAGTMLVTIPNSEVYNDGTWFVFHKSNVSGSEVFSYVVAGGFRVQRWYSNPSETITVHLCRA